MTIQKETIEKYKPSLFFFLTSALTPFVGTMCFLRTTSPFILLPVYFFALIVLVVSSVQIRRGRAKKNWVIPIAIGMVLLYFLTYGLQVDVADAVYFKVNENKLRELVSDIKVYGKINEMSDGQRYWKSVNNVTVEPSMKNVDTLENGFGGKKYFLDDVLTRNGIDKKKYEMFRQQLIATGFISFAVQKDGSISFTMDGMLDNCHGLSYSETGGHPKFNDCGKIIRWVKISDNWYAWGTT